MKLSYFELLSPAPVYLQNTGGIISPKLKDIAAIGMDTYRLYLKILTSGLDISNVIIADNQSALLLQKTLNFFIKENVIYSFLHKCFLVQDGDTPVGIINSENYSLICDLICQRNFIRSNPGEDLSSIKNKKALEITQKLQKGRALKAKHKKSDENMELGNIISAVANKSYSLNIFNIWELTVFQLWDCFFRLSGNCLYDIQSMSVAAWGNKDNSFDAGAWFKKIDTGN